MHGFQNAVILHKTKYQENSLLLTLWTENNGKIKAIAHIKNKPLQQYVLYEPFSLFNIKIKLADTLSVIKYIELKKNFFRGSYLSKLSRLYLNEILFWLLPRDHNDQELFTFYIKVIDTLINNQDLSKVLISFELKLLTSLGYGFSYDFDYKSNPIHPKKNYTMLAFSAFYPTTSNKGILGKTILKLGSPISSWSKKEFYILKNIIRLNLNACLNGKIIRSRKLLRNYLNNKK